MKAAALVIASLAVAAAGCSGRDPAIAKNDDATIAPPPPPPAPHIRTLSKAKKLFGAMPVENRFQDPLVTYTGVGWVAYGNDGQSYGTVTRFVDDSPTGTPFLAIPTTGNPSGATLFGMLKSSSAPLHVELWVGRDGDDGNFDNVDAEFVGLFADGSGEQVVQLTPDAASKTVIAGRTWVKVTADLAEGAIGWADVFVSDAALSASARQTLYVGGPVAVDVPSGAGAALVSSPKRPITERERLLHAAVTQHRQQLSAPRASLPPALPGMPRPL